MSESLGNTVGLVSAERTPLDQRLIDTVILDGDTVCLALTQRGKQVSLAYVLCSFEGTDSNVPEPEQAFDIPLTISGELPESFEFPKLQEVFSFRMFLSECTQTGQEIQTVQPGIVQCTEVRVIDEVWTIPLQK